MITQKLKSGKDEIVYLLSCVVKKYTKETGTEIILNTNRKNYEGLAIFLSNITNQLPEKAEEWETDAYPLLIKNAALDYPYRKYDITSGQIKDALNGIVSNPRHFLVDACYVYLYGKGRKGFEKNPIDDNLIEGKEIVQHPVSINNSQNIIDEIQLKLNKLEATYSKTQKKYTIAKVFAAVLLLLLSGIFWFYFTQKNKLDTLKSDMSVLPYKPTKAEIDSIEGIWLCYTGSPQARISNADRYHKVVNNLLEIKYKDGYFVFDRYGASFNHVGYMQFESPGIVSIYSRIKTNNAVVASPRHSLMNINLKKDGFIAAMSTSWNFDVGNNNRIVGIRELYKKMGKDGSLKEVINEVENATCQCKIVKWMKADNTTQVFYLKNQDLEKVTPKSIQPLINERSIILNEPDSSIVLVDSVWKN
jgi:hypothetical protein